MSALAVRLLITMLAVVAILGMTFKAGDNYRNNAWLASQAKVERQAKADYEAEVKRGDDASGAFLVEHQTMQSNFQNLTEKFNGLSKRSLLVRNSAGGVACAAGSASPAPPTVADAIGLPGADSDRLTAGAVWMWNSALTGTDQPSGACGFVDTSEAACAAPTTATVDDAWANHRTNAQLCAEDRVVHQRLFDFLTAKPAK